MFGRANTSSLEKLLISARLNLAQTPPPTVYAGLLIQCRVAFVYKVERFRHFYCGSKRKIEKNVNITSALLFLFLSLFTALKMPFF